MKSARDSPVGGSGVLLAAQLLSLLKGEQYFGRQYGNRSGNDNMLLLGTCSTLIALNESMVEHSFAG